MSAGAEVCTKKVQYTLACEGIYSILDILYRAYKPSLVKIYLRHTLEVTINVVLICLGAAPLSILFYETMLPHFP